MLIKVEREEFLQIRDLIHEKAGLYFDERKRYFVEKRVAKRIQASASESFRNYYRTLKYGHNNEELLHLLELLTTNETYFYRHIPQLESFAEEALPLILEEKRQQNNYQLNIWSAACSSGEEPYTLAIFLRETIPDFERWKIDLLATDLDRNILAKARKAIYDKRSIKDVPPGVLKKYFRSLDDGRYQLTSPITSMVRFQRLNLIDRSGMRQHRGKDVIFCRNVLIYFDDHYRKQVVHSLYNSLNKNGFIFLGHSESVGRISAAFQLVKFKKSLTYQK